MLQLSRRIERLVAWLAKLAAPDAGRLGRLVERDTSERNGTSWRGIRHPAADLDSREQQAQTADADPLRLASAQSPAASPDPRQI